MARKKTNSKAAEANSNKNEVRIGVQIWMAENLDVDHFRNGDPIPEAKTDEEWQQADDAQMPAWCYYDNESGHGPTIGKLYNWYAVTDSRELAPEGWRIPEASDWQELMSTIGHTKGGDEHEAHGFKLPMGGIRLTSGDFTDLDFDGCWWSSSAIKSEDGTDAGESWSFYMVYEDHNSPCGAGLSVRCIREYSDDDVEIEFNSEDESAFFGPIDLVKYALRKYGPDHPKYGESLYDLAKVYQSTNDFERAIEYFLKCLAIQQNALGPEHKGLAMTYYRLAESSSSLEDYSKAVEYFGKCLELELKAHGPDHKDNALTYYNLAEALYKLEDYGKALEYFEKCLEIERKTLGLDHNDLSLTYFRMAEAAYAQGKVDRALDSYEKSLAITIKGSGVDDEKNVPALLGIAKVWNNKNDHKKAEEYYNKVLAIRRKNLDREEPSGVTEQQSKWIFRLSEELFYLPETMMITLGYGGACYVSHDVCGVIPDDVIEAAIAQGDSWSDYIYDDYYDYDSIFQTYGAATSKKGVAMGLPATDIRFSGGSIWGISLLYEEPEFDPLEVAFNGSSTGDFVHIASSEEISDDWDGSIRYELEWGPGFFSTDKIGVIFEDGKVTGYTYTTAEDEFEFSDCRGYSTRTKGTEHSLYFNSGKKLIPVDLNDAPDGDVAAWKKALLKSV